ncbi:2'-5' RNA ligase family protein [Angustibacter sp. Root456]|uniref:2'-5' RNA ligase family protein n=1 Tax=Angustibacter sp. Root456 TaxID=1736539 RepID=UPI00138F8618|nr:2'-5' RNA ligase family protein [Angustibacter sp. Root456]
MTPRPLLRRRPDRLAVNAQAAAEERPRPQYDTGLILALPQLAAFTSPWRSTSYVPGHPALPIERRFPPHVTLLAPWAPADDGEALERLRAVAQRGRPLRIEFTAADLFPESGVVYLTPTPTAELTELFDDVLATFPDHPPYGGLHDTVVPHLTVSADGGPAQLAQVRAALAEHGPVWAETDRICVFGRGDDDIWRQTASVVLGSGDLAPHCL